MSKKILFIDVETGGLDPAKHSILTLGACVWNDGVIEDTFEVKIKEDEIVAEPEALKVNGINLDELRDVGVSPNRATILLHNFLLKHDMYKRKITLGGHNVVFDVGFLQRLYRLAECYRDYRLFYSHRPMCTMTMANILMFADMLPINSASGDTVFKYFGCAPERTNDIHEALGDAIASAKSFTEMLKVVQKGK